MSQYKLRVNKFEKLKNKLNEKELNGMALLKMLERSKQEVERPGVRTSYYDRGQKKCWTPLFENVIFLQCMWSDSKKRQIPSSLHW